jgi:SAM-dependent methyltransferase
MEEDMDTLVELVRERYRAAAVQAQQGAPKASCCGTGSDCAPDPITSDLYDAIEAGTLPPKALLASLGCGNPTALAELHPGETVLDLGSGGGIDVLLSARRVGPTGKAYGLDMTDAMLDLARQNQREAGATNVEFLKGQIEAIPLPDASVDVIISNCVVNLSGDKDQVFREAFRVLKPGGRLAISDVLTRGDLPPDVQASMPLWTGCVAGALDEGDCIRRLTLAGFGSVSIEPTRMYTAADAHAMLSATGLDADRLAPLMEGRVMSGFIRATKPAGCCGPDCCGAKP